MWQRYLNYFSFYEYLVHPVFPNWFALLSLSHIMSPCVYSGLFLRLLHFSVFPTLCQCQIFLIIVDCYKFCWLFPSPKVNRSSWLSSDLGKTAFASLQPSTVEVNLSAISLHPAIQLLLVGALEIFPCNAAHSVLYIYHDLPQDHHD